MDAEKKRPWLLPVIVAAAVIFSLALVVVPLLWTLRAHPTLEAEDAKVRLVFSVGVEAGDDADVVLKSVCDTLEQRLRSSGDVAGFLVRVAGNDRIEVLTGELTESQQQGVIELLTRSGTLEFALLANHSDHAELIADATAGTTAESESGEWAWVPVGQGKEVQYDGGRFDVCRETESGVREFLIVRELPEVPITGGHLERATVGFSPDGTPALDFKLDQRGAFLFQQLTAANAPRPGAGFKSRLAIILDGKIHSAPTINAMIGGGRGQITGNFTEAEVRRMTTALSAGELPAAVEFVEIEYLAEQ